MGIILGFIRGITNSSIGSILSQIFQAGLLGTVAMFISNMAKTIQRNIVHVTTASVATTLSNLETANAA